MSNRLDNTRVVVFESDYVAGKKILYKAGEKNYIHKDVVAKIEAKKGVKMKVSNFDEKGEIEKAKKALADSKKVQ